MPVIHEHPYWTFNSHNMAKWSHFAVFRNLYFSIAALAGLSAIGVGGYILIEDYSLLEAFYMTVITLSTVGFLEVRPLSSSGQLFTSLLIISSFGIFAYAISVITRSVLSGELGRYYKIIKVQNKIDQLNNHVVICGYGRNGRRAAKKLQAYNQEFVVIENNPQIIEQYLKGNKLLYVDGDAREDEILHKAGISRAKSLISTLNKDTDNLFVVISARELNTRLNIISRASTGSAEKKLRSVGASHVVLPEGVGGAQMATLVMSPNLVEFLEFLSVEGRSAINLEEIEVRQLTDQMGSMKISDLKLRQQTGCTIIGLKNPDGSYNINPDADSSISPNSRLFVLGKPEEIKHLNKIIHS